MGLIQSFFKKGKEPGVKADNKRKDCGTPSTCAIPSPPPRLGVSTVMEDDNALDIPNGGVFIGPVTQEELIITWEMRRRERLENERLQQKQTSTESASLKTADGNEPKPAEEDLTLEIVEERYPEVVASVSCDTEKATYNDDTTSRNSVPFPVPSHCSSVEVPLNNEDVIAKVNRVESKTSNMVAVDSVASSVEENVFDDCKVPVTLMGTVLSVGAGVEQFATVSSNLKDVPVICSGEDVAVICNSEEAPAVRGCEDIPAFCSGEDIPVICSGEIIPGIGSVEDVPAFHSGEEVLATCGCDDIPAFCSGEDVPVICSGEDIPAFCSVEDIPAFFSGEDVPVICSGEDVPVIGCDEDVPAFCSDEDVPVICSGEGFPAISSGEGITVICGGEDVPVICSGEDVPVFCSGEDVPVICSDEDVPAFCSVEDVPAFCSNEDVPVICSGEGVPAISSGEGITVICGDEDVPVICSSEGVPAISSGEKVPTISSDEDVFAISSIEDVFAISGSEDVSVVCGGEEIPAICSGEVHTFSSIIKDSVISNGALGNLNSITHSVGEMDTLFQNVEDNSSNVNLDTTSASFNIEEVVSTSCNIERDVSHSPDVEEAANVHSNLKDIFVVCNAVHVQTASSIEENCVTTPNVEDDPCDPNSNPISPSYSTKGVDFIRAVETSESCSLNFEESASVGCLMEDVLENSPVDHPVLPSAAEENAPISMEVDELPLSFCETESNAPVVWQIGAVATSADLILPEASVSGNVDAGSVNQGVCQEIIEVEETISVIRDDKGVNCYTEEICEQPYVEPNGLNERREFYVVDNCSLTELEDLPVKPVQRDEEKFSHLPEEAADNKENSNFTRRKRIEPPSPKAVASENVKIISGIQKPSTTPHLKSKPKSRLPILRPAKLNVDPSTIKSDWVKRLDMSKIPEPKRPAYVHPLHPKK